MNERAQRILIYEKISNELNVDSFPIANIIYLKSRNLFSSIDKKNNVDLKNKIQRKMYKKIYQKLVDDICKKYQANSKDFLNWFNHSNNERGKNFE